MSNIRQHNIILTSTSEVKYDAFKNSKFGFISSSFNTIGLCCVKVITDTPQPFGDNGGLAVARQRIRNYIAEYPENASENIIMAIESYLVEIDGEWYDKCVVVTEWNGHEQITYSEPSYLVSTPSSAVRTWLENPELHANAQGYDITLGDVVNSLDQTTPSDDWYQQCNPFTRREYISTVLNQINLAELIRPQLHQPPAVGPCSAISDPLKFQIIQALIRDCLTTNHSRFSQITHVVGLDTPGSIMGTLVASMMGCGFIIVSKHGDLLDGNILRASHMTPNLDMVTYEIQTGILNKESQVLIVDDCLADDIPIRAATELVHACGVESVPLYLVGSINPDIKLQSCIAINLVSLL